MHKVRMSSRNVPGIDEIVRAGLVVSLNQNLANLTDLAAAYKQAHWNVVGINFAHLHLLFDEFAAQTQGYMDTIAERVVTIGGTARGTIQAAVNHSSLPEFPVEEREQYRLLEELVGRIDTVTADLRQAMDKSADEPATQDVFVEVVRGIEKQRWMLQSHLATR